MEYSTHVLVQQVPLSEQNFETKLQEVSDQITSNGYSCPTVFTPLNSVVVQQAVISASHIGFLLQDGRICRVSYRVLADKIEPIPPETTKSKPKIIQPTRPQSRTSIRPSFERPSFENLVLSSSAAAAQAANVTGGTTNSTAGQSDIMPQLQAGYPLSRPRHHLIRTARGRTGIIFGSRPLIPASSVPEELIEQVQVVLQGKSRNVIIRELQRTNLDVNMAVNNLLARDDEGDEDLDDDYVGADLISLLDVNPHGESGIILESEFFDEADFALRYSNIQRRVSARIGSGGSSGANAATAVDNNSGSLTSSTNPPTGVASAPSSTSNPLGERERKRNRYDPRWLDGSLREELFGRIERELKPDDLSIVKEQTTNVPIPSKTTKQQQTPQSHHHHSHSHHYSQHSSTASIQQQHQSINHSLNSVQQSNPIIFGDQLQYWTDGDNNYPRFTHIACLYSELIAINTAGQLCQWRWIDDYPYQDPDNSQIKHPKTSMLLLTNEKLISLSGNIIRASVLTDTNKIATWIDETLGQQVSVKLQHQAQELPFSSQQQVIDVQTSSLFTVIRTDLNEMYWYGILPTKQRKKLLERIKDKTRKSRSTNLHSHHHSSSSSQQLTQGCSVCLISNPYYNQGAWGFYIKDGQPKFGQLMEQAWVLTNTARFRIKTPESFATSSSLAAAAARLTDSDKSQVEMPPPPSPASSTCSVDSSASFGGLKRKKQSASANAAASQTTSTQALIGNVTSNTTSALTTLIDSSSSDDHHSKIKDEEYWPIEEVVFIEDCKVAPIGKVMKIDGSLVLVRFPSKTTTHHTQNTNDMSMDTTNTNELDNCRLLRKDDLQIVKGNMTPKTPDCSLSIANIKRISLENGTLLTFSVDKDYLHTLQLRQSTVYYIQYEIGSNNGLCRSIRQNFLPSITSRQSLSSFLASNTTDLSNTVSPSSPRLYTLNANEIPRVLLDSNKTFYPIVYNQDLTNIKDPQWKNLLPLNYFQQQIVPIKNADHLPKNYIVLSIMQIQKGLLIPHILRYDYDKIRSILNEIETTKNKDLLKLILNERLDGCRNIFHACVSICAPLSNKDYSTADTSDLFQSTTTSSTAPTIASYPWNPVTSSNENNSNSKRITFAIDLLHNQTTNTSTTNSSTTTSNNDHNYQGTRTTTNERSEVSTWPPPPPPPRTNETEDIQQQSSTISTPSQQAQPATNFYRSSSTGSHSNSGGSVSPSSNTNTSTFSAKFQQIQYLQHQFQQHQAIAALTTSNTTTNSGSSVTVPPHSPAPSTATSPQPVFAPVIYAQNTSSYPPPIGSRSSRSTNINSEYQIWSSVKYDEKERRLRSIKILRLLLDSSLFQEYLIDLLSFRNVEGLTPFMSAVNSRAYNCALILFEYASKLAKEECLNKNTQSNDDDQEQHQNLQFFLDNTSISPPLFESATNCLNVPNINHSEYQSILMRMIYPSDCTNFDDSPLYTICTNDTCSFTWTGEEHINQDIFECKTCGLHGTLCCCTECAQTCHKGHDCRLKRTSPTAYCDCWEVCKCKSLIGGEQLKRLELLKLLLMETNLVQMKNNRYENILLYLTQTVGRQIIEQQQFGKNTQSAQQQQLQQSAQQTKQQRATGGASTQTKKLAHTQQVNPSANSTNNPPTDNNDSQGQATNNVPDHDLEPPQFCRRALELILADWCGVKSMLLCGCTSDDPSTKKASDQPHSSSSSTLLSYNNETLFSLEQQQQTTQLDRFTYLLLSKCNIKQGSTIMTKSQQQLQNQNDMIDILLQTLLREMSNPVNKQLAKYAAARFVRSVLRLFVTLSIESLPDKSAGTTLSTTANSSNITSVGAGIRRFISATTVNGTTITATGTGTCHPQIQTTSSMIIQHCKRIFQTLIKISIRELASMAEALIAPVRYGCAKPTAHFQLVSTHTDAIQGLEEVFNVDSQYYRAYQENNLSNMNAVSTSSGGGGTNNVRWSASTIGVGSTTVTTATTGTASLPTSNETRSRELRPGVSSDENYTDIVEQDLDNDLETGVGTVDDDDSDTQSQHGGTDRTTTGTGIGGTRDGGTGVLSDNESEMELELLAESDTDNESNRSARLSNAQRTSATAGSDPGMAVFSDDDSGESTNDDADSVRSDSVLDETSQQELISFDDNRDQMGNTATVGDRSTSQQQPSTLAGITATTVPSPAYQTSNTTSTRLTTTRTQGSLFGETHPRRQIQPSNTSTSQQQQAVQQQSHQHQSQQQQQQQNSSVSSTITTNAMLARAFAILVKQITDLLLKWPSFTVTSEAFSPLYHDIIPETPTKSQPNTDPNDTLDAIQAELEQRLLPTWQWFCTIMDSFESQIRFGISLSNLSSNDTDTSIQGNRFLRTTVERAKLDTKKKTTANRLTTNPQTTEPVINNRRDFLNYSLSLMRMPENEHGDQLPILDVLSYKHIAYIFDSFIYYLRESQEHDSTTFKTLQHVTLWRDINDQDTSELNAEDMILGDNHTDIPTTLPRDQFFHRSDSTLCLGSLAPDPFHIPVDDSLPLACRPQLLQPTCRKEDLFGRFLYENAAQRYAQLPSRLGMSDREHSIPDFIQPNYAKGFKRQNQDDIEMQNDKTTKTQQRDDDRMAVDVLLDLSSGLSTTNKQQHTPTPNKQLPTAPVTATTSTTTTRALPTGSYEYLMARWRYSLELFVKIFIDDVGAEPGSIIYESGGFQAREQRFRHDMERLKNLHQKDIRFESMERDRALLISKTFRTLNSHYYRNQNTNSSSTTPPLAVQRVKVTFKDEPGEGSGVARSFYAAIVEAILSDEKLSHLELGTYGGSSAAAVGAVALSTNPRQQRSRERRTIATYLRRSMLLSSEARPFKPVMSPSVSLGSPTSATAGNPAITTTTDSTSSNESSADHWTPSKTKIGLTIYPKVAAIQPFHAEKITGMLLEGLPTLQLQRISSSSTDDDLRVKVEEAMNVLTSHSTRDVQTESTSSSLTSKPSQQQQPLPSQPQPQQTTFDKQLDEYAPLFWQPDKKGFYAPRPGKYTTERLTAYRNVGRLIGLCLLQNELLPLPMCRHVIKYILNRRIRWHDLAFFDSSIYENLRRAAYDAEKTNGQSVKDLHLTFSLTCTDKEGGETYDLIPDGSSKDVTYSNLYDFIKRYAEFRMVKLVEQSLHHIRLGVFDVLPSNALDGLSAEDFRLLLNGSGNINITTLTNYTTFNDESGEAGERITQFKKWFWSVLEKFGTVEKQDLVYFWTGSPALPASEGGFQPMPSVTIRPADDQHLPTANTCISRLYVPLYSSKTILKTKLLYAIKTKQFGFV